MSEAKVALCETDLPSFITLAARLADMVFPDQLTFPFKERDPDRVLWFTQVSLLSIPNHRREYGISVLDSSKEMDSG